MEGLILLGLAIPIGLFVGWCLGISAWRQVRRLRGEVAALRQALSEAGIAVPAAAPEAAPNPSPWAARTAPPAPGPATPEPEPVPVLAAAAEPAAPNPWAAAAAAAPPPPPEPPARRPGLEELLTLRWGTWLGAAVLLLAGVFLVRTAVEEGWLGPEARCALAGLLGVALIAGAEWLRRRPAPERPNIPWPDQAPGALAAGGAAVLFGAAYATASLYALVPPLVGFGLMAAAALAALGLALVHGPVVAAVGILGAYATPVLVDSQDPSLPGLFAYLLVVTAAALAVVRQVGAAWLGWAATAAAAGWVVIGGAIAGDAGDLWAPMLFLPAAAALHLALLPGAALDGAIGRRLAWVPVGLLAGAGLLVMVAEPRALAPMVGLLLLTPVAIWKGAREPRMDLLPWLAAATGLAMLLLWPIGAWAPTGEEVTAGDVVVAILPNGPWAPDALQPFLIGALVLAAMHAAAGLVLERRAPRPLRWASLVAAVPVLVLLVAYARVKGFALDPSWALVALAIAAGLVATATAARRADDLPRAGTHAAGAVAALSLGAAMILRDQWLTMAVAFVLPPLAFIEGRAGLPALRRVAMAVAGVVLVRLLVNWNVLGYDLGTWPVLNGLWLTYGVPAALFALAAAMFRRRGDDVPVAVLEAGAVAFATALMVLQIRHAMTGGDIAGPGQDFTFREAALQVLGLALLATGLRLLDRRLGRPVLSAAWRLQQGAVMVAGALLIAANPAFDSGAQVAATPIANELLVAYALPALLAALAARAKESDVPPGFRPALAAYAGVAGFAWVTLEVRHLFQPEAMALDLVPPGEAELYAYSGAWLGVSALLLALGIRSRVPALRIAGLAVMALTIGKAFIVDMQDLVGLWRVLSFLGLGLALIALGWVYRRFVVTPPAPTPATAP